MAKPPHAFTATNEQRAQVLAMAGYGLPQVQIAVVLGIAKNTLVKHFTEELALGLARVNLQIGESLVAQAVGRKAETIKDEHGRVTIVREELKPDKSAAIFLGKVRLGYQETTRVEVDFLDKYDLSKLTLEELTLVRSLLAKAARREAGAGGDDGSDRRGPGGDDLPEGAGSPAPGQPGRS